MSDEYDLGHLYQIMEAVSAAARDTAGGSRCRCTASRPS